MSIKKILVVEDNEKNRILLRQLLTYHGYEIIEAENGIEGIEIAKKIMPDLILMDIQMPLMDGYSAIKILKNNLETRHIKIIAVTSFAMRGDRENSLRCGADDYISKPIDTMELPNIIKRNMN